MFRNMPTKAVGKFLVHGIILKDEFLVFDLPYCALYAYMGNNSIFMNWIDVYLRFTSILNLVWIVISFSLIVYMLFRLFFGTRFRSRLFESLKCGVHFQRIWLSPICNSGFGLFILPHSTCRWISRIYSSGLHHRYAGFFALCFPAAYINRGTMYRG